MHGIHVENDHLRQTAIMDTINLHPVHVGQHFSVRIARQQVRLKAYHLAALCGLSVDGLPPMTSAWQECA